MKILLEELRDVLAEELKTYEEMLELTIRKTDVITKGKVNELDGITHMENNMIVRLGQYEDRREKVIENIQRQLKIEDGTTISELLNYVDDSDKIKKEIENITEKLTQVLNTLKEKNDLNTMLINDTLEYIQLNLNLLTNATEQGTYNDKVQKEKGSPNINIFDTKA